MGSKCKFCPERVAGILHDQKWAPPINLHSSAPPPPPSGYLSIRVDTGKLGMKSVKCGELK